MPKNQSEPSTVITVKLEIAPSDLERLPVAVEAARAMAAYELRSQPFEAGLVGWLAAFADDIRFAAMAARAHPEPDEDEPQGGHPMPAPKVKHVFGSNGICTVKHDGKTTCSAVRTRKPRAGSKAAAAAEAAEKTGTLPAVDPRQTSIPGAEDTEDHGQAS